MKLCTNRFRSFLEVGTALLICGSLLVSCGSKSTDTISISSSKTNGASFWGGGDSYSASDDYESVSDNYVEDSYSYGDSSINSVSAAAVDTSVSLDISGSIIKQEMLVYSCTMQVDVLDFDGSTQKFKGFIKQYQGFIEDEVYDDNSSSSRYYDATEQKWHSLKATVRIPSRVYDAFCEDVSALGDLRRKSASVENVSQEYHDLGVTLEIYEAKEDRYLELLAKAKDETNAIAIEETLTDIQVQIAKIKTRMNEIKTDVAYSYVYVTFNEVREYQETPEPVKTDTFFDRLSNNVKNTWAVFLKFLENCLFLFITFFPYLVLFVLVFFIFRAVFNVFGLSKKFKQLWTKSSKVKAGTVPDKSNSEASVSSVLKDVSEESDIHKN